MAENNSESCKPNKPCEPCETSKPCDSNGSGENTCPYPSCGCIGYGYVPVQEFNCTYDTKTAILSGTVFPELDLDICEYGTVCKKWGGTVDE